MLSASSHEYDDPSEDAPASNESPDFYPLNRALNSYIDGDPYHLSKPKSNDVRLIEYSEFSHTQQTDVPRREITTIIKNEGLSSEVVEFICGYLRDIPAKQKRTLPAGGYHFTSNNVRHEFTLAHDLTEIGAIDCTKLEAGDAFFLRELIHSTYQNYYLPAGKHVIGIRNEAGDILHYYLIETLNDLVVRKNKYGNMVCDVIDQNNAISHGSFGEIYFVLGTIKYRYLNRPGYVFEPGNKRRIVKLLPYSHMYIRDFNYYESVYRESDVSAHCPHFSSRSLFAGSFADGTVVHGMSFRYFEGKPVHDHLLRDLKKPHFSVTDCFELSIELFQALSSQFHRNGVIHGDIKDDNILIAKLERWKAVIIDAGLGRIRGSKFNSVSGAISFRSKEAFEHQCETPSDVFSMSLVVALIWRDKCQRTLINARNRNLQTLKERNDNGWIIKFDMFDDMPELPAEYRTSIVELLTRITDPDQTKRPDAETCARAFQSIYDCFKALTLPPEKLSISFFRQPTSNMAEFFQALNMMKNLLNDFNSLVEQNKNSNIIKRHRDEINQFCEHIANTPCNHHSIADAIEHIKRKHLKMQDVLHASARRLHV